MKIKKMLLILVVILLGAQNAVASTINAKDWGSETEGVHTIQLWTTDSEVSFKSVNLSNDSLDGWSWAYTDDTQTSVVLTGPEASTGDISASFQFTSPNPFYDFEVEWAEVSTATTVTGTNYYDNKHWSYTQGEISNTPTPAPAALILLGGGLSLLALIRRKFGSKS